MTTRNYSKDALLLFLASLSDLGLANVNTAEGMRVAVTKILADLSPEEDADVRRIDVDAAVHRFHNRNPGAIRPASLAEYKRRVANAIRHFVIYTENPTSFRPIGRGAPKSGPAGEKRDKEKRSTSKPRPQAVPAISQPAIQTLPESTAASSGLVLNYPLRSDFLAQVLVPRDMKRDEARRMCAFIMTLASDFVPEA